MPKYNYQYKSVMVTIEDKKKLKRMAKAKKLYIYELINQLIKNNGDNN